MDIDFKALEARAKSTETQYKTLSGVKFKTGEADLAEGEFLAYAAVFGNQDSYGDVIRPGAFLESIAGYETAGKTIGFYFGHNMTDADANLGWILSAKEDSFGLLVHGKFDLEDEKSTRTWKKVKGGRFDQLSFGYKILEGGWIESSEHRGGGFFELRKLHIYEVSVVPIGANEETHFVAVKAGKTLSAKNAEKINTAIAAVETALSTLKDVIATSTADDAPADSAKAAVQQTTTANTSEPSQDEEPTPSAEVKSSDSMRSVSAYMSAQLQLLALANGEN
jgi:HK97 family phage prohead protease